MVSGKDIRCAGILESCQSVNRQGQEDEAVSAGLETLVDVIESGPARPKETMWTIQSLLADLRLRVVQAILKGTFEAMPRYRKLPHLRKVSIRFGKLIGASDLPSKSCDPVDPQQIANRLHEAFARQAGEDHEPLNAIGP